MDRNAVLAIILSLVVVLLFQTFLLPKPQRRPVEMAADSTSVDRLTLPDSPSVMTQGGIPPQDRDPSSPEPTDFIGASEEKTLTVDTDLFVAEFTNRGGQLRSWTLKRYQNPFHSQVQIVPEGRTELGLVLETPSGEIDLRSTLFDYRDETLPDGGRRIVFEAHRSGSIIRKTFLLQPDDYLMDLQVQIDNLPDLTNYRVGWTDGIPRAEKNPKHYDSSLGAIVLLGKNKETVRPKDFKNEPRRMVEGNVRWAGVRNKYFMAVVVPPNEISSRVLATGSNEPKTVGAEVIMPVLQGRALHDFKVYLGPMEYNRLRDYDLHLEAAVDLGFKIFRPISKLLLASMTWLHGFIPNYGIVIIIIAALTKILFYPLTKSSLKSMRAMQRLQPEINALREKYKGDNQKMQSEMMGLYKTHKVNPVGGCLPILLQMPVFFALYQVLSNSIAMRNADFFLWINDLSSPDTITTIGGFAIHVIPIILFGFTVLQQIWTPVGDQRQKMMGYMMPIVTLFIFYGFPAGLNLYWTVNSIMTVAQQWWIHREDPTRARPAASTA